MKVRNLLAVIVFMAAIGSAIASAYLTPIPGYTSKADVPAQTNNCELRDECNGSTNVCTYTVDHDGSSATPDIAVPLRPGFTQQGVSCGLQLMKN